jgi:hypothetical protein
MIQEPQVPPEGRKHRKGAVERISRNPIGLRRFSRHDLPTRFHVPGSRTLRKPTVERRRQLAFKEKTVLALTCQK